MFHCVLGAAAILWFSQGSGVSRAQTDSTCSPPSAVHLLGISAGVGDYHSRDEYLSPYTFRCLMFAAGVRYEIIGEDLRHEFNATFDLGHPESDRQVRNVKQIFASLSYDLLPRVTSWEIAGHPCELVLGPGIQSFLSNTEFDASNTPEGMFDDQSWYWSHSLNVTTAAVYRWETRTSLQLRLTMPMVRFISRPDNGHYLSDRNWDIILDFAKSVEPNRWEFFWEQLVLGTEIEFRHGLGQRLELRASYRFTFVSSREPLEMAMYMNTLSLGVVLVL
jgi:hypothetical protein